MQEWVDLTRNLVLCLMAAGVLAAIWAGITSIHAADLDKRVATLEAARAVPRRREDQ